MSEPFSLERTTVRPSDAEIEAVADEIFELVRVFDSPKDASAALLLAQWKTLDASFPLDRNKEAIEAIEGDAALLKKFLAERVE